jgi:predicted RNase H-like HicB family nuclease
MLEYHAAYYREEDGWFVASVLDFPGVNTQGRTLPSARRMVKDALLLMTEWHLEEAGHYPGPIRAPATREPTSWNPFASAST